MSQQTDDLLGFDALEPHPDPPVDHEVHPAPEHPRMHFPIRISPHLRHLMRDSEPVSRQFLPDPRELTSTAGQTRSFSGLLRTGVAGVERMYPDRCIVMPQPSCPAYCRFCFRKFYAHSHGHTMSYADLDRALAYIDRDQRLREVLITGGEPVMDPDRLTYLLRGLRRIDHIGPIRVACRSLITAPSLVNRRIIGQFRDHQDLRRGKPVEVALHCNHPDEISRETTERLAVLREHGLHVYNQTVLLRDVNVETDVLLTLLRRLRNRGVETYHLYVPDPVRGTDHMRPTLARALMLKTALRRRATGRLNPQLIVTTRLGKVEIGVDGWIVEREPTGRHVWIRTPYTLATFREIDPRFDVPADARIDGDGHIVMRYLDGLPSSDPLEQSNPFFH